MCGNAVRLERRENVCEITQCVIAQNKLKSLASQDITEEL
jgi:hypothetical protein